MVDNTTATTNNTKIVSSTASRPLILGHDADWWSNAVVFALAAAAIAAALLVAATMIANNLQKREADQARHSLENFKADAAKQIAEAKQQGINAGLAANDAHTRAAAANAEAAKANAQAAEARKSAAEANERVAVANERAAALQKEAEEARLEQEKLKSALAWRTLTPSETGALERALGAQPGTVTLWYTLGDPEALFTAIQFARILENAHWNVAPAGANLSGIQFGIALNNADNPDGQRLASALSSAGIKFSTAPIPPMAFTSGATQVPNAPLLMIGSRNPAIFP